MDTERRQQMEDTRRELKAIEERVTRAVCHVNGIVTAEEIDELERLRGIVGEEWDAINRRWISIQPHPED